MMMEQNLKASAENQRNEELMSKKVVDVDRHRFPNCVVWTPIPCITWLLPFVGHMGIGTTSGLIRDFAGSYFVAEDDMGFGWPTRYWQLNLEKVSGGPSAFDAAVADASQEYKSHMHNLICDNCHSHVAMALNLMRYGGKTNWNMFKLTFCILFYGKYANASGFVKQWLPFMILVCLVLILSTVVKFSSV